MNECRAPAVQSAGSPYLPEWVFLLREELKILVSQLNGTQGLQLQVCPALNKAGQIDKRVQTQAVIPVVRQMSHEDTDLKGEQTKYLFVGVAGGHC